VQRRCVCGAARALRPARVWAPVVPARHAPQT
jgi:hypothetical protein